MNEKLRLLLQFYTDRIAKHADRIAKLEKALRIIANMGEMEGAIDARAKQIAKDALKVKQ